MPFSDCFASRMTAGSLAAIWLASGSCGGAQLARRHHLEHGAEGQQLLRGDGPARVDHGPHQRLRHQPGQVRGRAQRAAVDLGQPERRVVGRDHDVRVAGQADAAAEAEAVHRGDHRHRAVVDGGERGEAALVGADQRLVPLGPLHLLDVHAGAEAAALRGEDHGPGRGFGPRRGDRRREIPPALHRQRVDRRKVDDHLGDPVSGAHPDAHRLPARAVRLPTRTALRCLTRTAASDPVCLQFRAL